MKLETKDGQLRLGSAFKLMVVAWTVSWGVLFGSILLLLALTAVLSGEINVHGETVTGLPDIMLALAPFFVGFPVVIAIQAVLFSGLMVFGLWIYRQWRPIRVQDDSVVSVFEAP